MQIYGGYLCSYFFVDAGKYVIYRNNGLTLHPKACVELPLIALFSLGQVSACLFNGLLQLRLPCCFVGQVVARFRNCALDGQWAR